MSKVEASTTIEDGVHTTERIMQHNGYWASALGVEGVELKVSYKDAIVINEIEITLHYLATHVEMYAIGP